MQYLLALTILSLFLPIRLDTGFVLLRPFGILVVMLLIALIVRRRGNVVQPHGLLMLLPFFGWHVISAFTAGAQNGLREFLQVGVVLMFAVVLAQGIGRLDPHKMARVLVWGMAAILVYAIGWHLANGYWVGWKRLADPRLAFTFLPIVLAGLILFARPPGRRRLWFAWAGMLPVLVMSGERKALLIYLFLSAALVARGRMALIGPPVMAGFVGLLVLASMVNNPYLQTQLNSIVDPVGTGRYEYFIATGTPAPGTTLSNAQRAFALQMSGRLFSKHPLVGVGTNQYKHILDTRFSHLPDALGLSVHGEFQRVLAENGIIGFSFYLLVWFSAWFRLRRTLRWGFRHQLVTAAQARLLPLVVFVPCVLYAGTEASGTRVFVVLALISLLPELTRHGLYVAASTRLSRRSDLVAPLPLVEHHLPRGTP